MTRHAPLHSRFRLLPAVMFLQAANVCALENENPVEPLELDPIVVVANRIPRPLSELAAQVTVIDAQQIQVGMVEDLDGMLKYEPGLDIETSGTRFGATGVNVRGIGGNRVLMEQDGISLRDRFVVGAFSDGGRALVETDRIKRVEVLYGPASVLYGSDALGGVIAITTWDPGDLLNPAGSPYSVGLRGGYQGSDDSWVASGIAALGRGGHGLLFAGTWRDGHQLDNRAPAGTPEDPQDWNSRDYMLRYTYDTDGGNRLRLTAMSQETDAETWIFSQLGYGRRFQTTTDLQGRDEDENQQYALAWDFSWGGWEQGTFQAWYASYSTDQATMETRGLASPPLELLREFHYDQDFTGLDFNLFREQQWGAAEHRIGVGLEWLQTDTSEFRDGLQTNLLTGNSTNIILGESLPVRDFPNSRSREFGVFIQDVISFAGDRWELTPALRWDHYTLVPRPDSLWLEDFSELQVASVTESDLTPRLGVIFHVDDEWSLYAQYARGFRAPPFEDANIGLDLPLFGYRAIPNPDLESETSDGFELGARRIDASSHFSLALFDTDYDNFIESRALVGVDEETGGLLFQSRNIGQARIYGVDLRYDQELRQWNDKLEGWMLSAAAYWARGKNRDSGKPLNSIAPPQAVLGLSWLSPGARWNVEAVTTFTAAKHQKDIDEAGGTRFATPSWVIFDLTVGWQPRDWLELRAGLFNLGNKTYWRWLDVARLDASDPMIPVLSRPGRNGSLTARITF